MFSTMFKKRDKTGVMRSTSHLKTALSFVVWIVRDLEGLVRRIPRLVTARVTFPRRSVPHVEDLIDEGIASDGAVLPAARGALLCKTTITFSDDVDAVGAEAERSRTTSPSSRHLRPMPLIPPNLTRAATDPWIATTSTRAHSPLSARCDRDRGRNHAEALTDVVIHGHPHEVASIGRHVRALLGQRSQ
ncbi:hypothetical protein AMAG_19783 [Allomyces macrogynus ATCC 38327]|uniref:Uncharacterized protein n=1 Tax=Allomyces macrogynus (strain ATCC 38327) TaxID=578462 RepID=A0A0L0T0E5_ALLM3|nr:hypothetical protein AMAG_19783 [Allomyces macrogynus ATCC 38327]|eukprot:KNE68241.1 hypothetical protein AMAG_19783 [Allomyces macrogynus ATCC 38327]